MSLGFRIVALVALVAGSIVVPVDALAGPPATGDLAHDSGLQWGFDRIGTTAAWETTRGAGVTIAVVDSGVAPDHEDLAPNLVGGTSCRGTDGDPDRCGGGADDDDGHGTHVAGIVGAVAGNEVGIAGVAPDARVLPVKVLHHPCQDCPVSGNAADVAAAVRWATDRGADIINLSLGSTVSSEFGAGFIDAVTYAWDHGAIPVVAAGNQFVLTADFGDAPAVIVSAVDRDDQAPSYSNGVGTARWAVAAPGGENDDTADSCSRRGTPSGILSTYWVPEDPSAYACLSGTSMAAPHVSGGLALLLAAGLDPGSAIETLLATATDLGPPGPDGTFGAGRIDLAAALAAAPSVAAASAASPTSSPASLPPDTTPATPADTAAGDGTGDVASVQPFVPGPPARRTPIGLVVLAVIGIIGTAAAVVHLDRRGYP